MVLYYYIDINIYHIIIIIIVNKTGTLTTASMACYLAHAYGRNGIIPRPRMHARILRCGTIVLGHLDAPCQRRKRRERRRERKKWPLSHHPTLRSHCRRTTCSGILLANLYLQKMTWKAKRSVSSIDPNIYKKRTSRKM